MNTQKPLKNRLKQLRTKRRMSVEQLSHLLNTNQGKIVAWENFESDPPVRVAIQICNCFGCSLDYFFCKTTQFSEEFETASDYYDYIRQNDDDEIEYCDEEDDNDDEGEDESNEQPSGEFSFSTVFSIIGGAAFLGWIIFLFVKLFS